MPLTGAAAADLDQITARDTHRNGQWTVQTNTRDVPPTAPPCSPALCRVIIHMSLIIAHEQPLAAVCDLHSLSLRARM